MKKISLGSFPLIDVVGKDRRIFESYLIKVISDLITSNQISNQIYADRVQYITPLSIMKFIKEDQKAFGSNGQVPDSKTQNDTRSFKAETIKHAFKNTKMLYQSIASDPFYRNNMFYPIYIEEIIKSNYGYQDYNYDFLILANDLIKQQIVDEITFDDKATLLFLVLKCLLTPKLQVNEIGTSKNGGENFRKYFALFLETCKSEDTNPFDMFIKLVKAAGKQKRNNIPGAMARLTGRIIGKPNKEDTGSMYHSNSFVNLFDTKGEIKDASFLLKEPLHQINKFLSDDGKGLDPNYNPILRQYSQAKTHEYGKILSVIDALGAFNKSNDVLTELNSNTVLSQIQIKGEDPITINKDTISGELETIYFRRFLEDLVKLESRAINDVRNQLLKQFNIDITNNQIATKESLAIDIAKNESDFVKVSRELKTWQDKAVKLTNVLGLTHFEDIPNKRPDLLNNIAYTSIVNNTATYQNEYQRLMQTMSIQNAQLATAPSQKGINDSFKDKAISLQVNLEIFQAQLTAMYSEIYQYIYSNNFNDHIVSIKDQKPLNATNILNTLFPTGSNQSPDLNSLTMTISEIAQMFDQEIEINIKNEIAKSFPSQAQKALQVNLKSNILNTINENTIKDLLIKNIFTPIFTKYTNRAISDSNQIKDIKSENNPVLKRILSSKDLFKAYLLNSETLVAAYELLHYVDTVKYEEGIINHPVSRVSNPINKMDFMIKRLGLGNNPVFIFNKENILLSMPAHLSLTGQNFISSVSMQEFVQFGQINWSKDLWDQNLMFGGPTNSKSFKDLSKSIDKIKDEIKAANETFKTAEAKQKIKIQAQIAQKQKELETKQAKMDEMRRAANGSTFTSNMQKDKRPENPSNYQMQYRPGGRYNTGMDQQGYLPHERNIIDQSRNGMDHLQQQNVPPVQYVQQPSQMPNGYTRQFINNVNRRLQDPNTQEDNVPYIHQYDPQYPQEQNNFMNNPYIQNRTNQLNQFQN